MATVRFGPWLLHVASMYLMVVAVLILLATSVWVHRGREKWTAAYSKGWLSTLPVTREALLGTVVMRSLAVPALIWLALSVATLVVAFVASPPISVGMLLIVGTASGIAGSMLGWWVPHRSATVAHPASQRAALAGERPADVGRFVLLVDLRHVHGCSRASSPA